MEDEMRAQTLGSLRDWCTDQYSVDHGDLKQALAGYTRTVKPAPKPDPLSRFSDSDLVMEMLARGFVIQKAPTE